MTPVDTSALVLRVVVGSIFLSQGVRKVLGAPDVAHGRGTLTATIAAGGLPYPGQLAWLVGITELTGGSLVLVGLLTRLAVIPLAVTLVIAIVRFKWSGGFLGGWDWPWSVLGATMALGLLGAGAFSLDALVGLP